MIATTEVALAMGRTDRYPLLPTVFKSVYPNPPAVTAYDTTRSEAKPPLPAAADPNALAGVAAKMENAASGAAYEASLSQLRRCAWLAAKEGNEDWAKLRDEVGAAGRDIFYLTQSNLRVRALIDGCEGPGTICKPGVGQQLRCCGFEF